MWCAGIIVPALMLCHVPGIHGEVDDDTVVAEANNAFALALYQKVAATPGNMMVCPLSASTVLTMAWLGSLGTTADQLRTVLRLPHNRTRVENGYRSLSSHMQGQRDVTVRFANKMYVQNGFNVKADFNTSMVQNLMSAVEEVDFESNAEETRLNINQWVENITDNTIRNLIAEGSLDSSTLLILVNAVFFKAAWENVFQTSSSPKDFHVDANTTVRVPMMTVYDGFPYKKFRYLKATAVKLPYKNQRYSMVILLPNEVDGLPHVEGRLSTFNMKRLDTMATNQVRVLLPKFKMETTIELKPILNSLGLTALFSADADLSDIADGPLYVSDVMQKTFVDVHENGTVATAATRMRVRFLSAAIWSRTFNFTVDHPFLFLIRDEDKKTILFIGRVQNPLDSSQ